MPNSFKDRLKKDYPLLFNIAHKTRLAINHIKFRMKLHYLRIRYRLPIMKNDKTIQYILDTNCSVARFGDGELAMVLKGETIGFQVCSDVLANELKDVLTADVPHLLVCIPHSMIFSYRRGIRKAVEFWENWVIRELSSFYPMLSHRRLWGDSQITRPYYDYKTSSNAKKIFPLLRKLWEGQDLLIVEGEKTRLGVGNDLFDGAKSIRRILAPAENAFSFRREILQAILDLRRDELVLLALGPTATVLTSDLAKLGIRAIDIGHVDIEYEWFLQGAKDRVAIPKKYVNEVESGNIVANETDPAYLSQIVSCIGCQDIIPQA